MSCNQRSRSILPFLLLVIIALLLLASTTLAAEKPILTQGNSPQIIGGSADGSAKARCDSFLVMGPWGSGAPFNGQFQAPANATLTCQWNGWTSEDNTAAELGYWHVDTYNAENLNGNGPGNQAAWCGSMLFETCAPEDVVGGYGNGINESLIWTAVVADPLQPAVITIDAWLNHNVEEFYDFVHIGYLSNSGNLIEIMNPLTGIGENFHLQQTFTCQPQEFGGELGNTITVSFMVQSDGAWSDEDCLYPSNGAIQIDDITVTVDNGDHAYFEDFESGTLGLWEASVFPGVGDFAHLDSQLETIDPCNTNYSCQVLFVDDGIVVPGTGGTMCIDWCYGPSGYIVNSTGGLAGPDYHLDNSILSPVMPWPENCATGGLFEYDIYEHEPLNWDSPGIFTSWNVRSTTSSNPEDIEEARWEGYNNYYYGEGYLRRSSDISAFLEPGARYVQVRLNVFEIGWLWGWFMNNATPAPYFDNVRVVAFDQSGPSMFTSESQLANDGFPASGVLDVQNPANNSVRFDMARNIATDDYAPVDAGDSVVISVQPRREGATLVGLPVMHYKIKPNTLFNPYRSVSMPMEGTVDGSQVVVGGSIMESRFCFDFPDTGLFFPGDVMHYYFTATDEVLGGGLESAILPADTLGFCRFDNALSYDQSFAFRALPTVQGFAGEEFITPDILFWDDLGQDSLRPQWHMALNRALGATGSQYDVYYTNAASSGLDNGLGRRATVEQLATYDIIFYASGILFQPTLGRVLDYTEEAPNLDLIESWLGLGDKNLFLAGDNIASDLSFSGTQGQAFLSDWIGVSCTDSDIRPYISGQASPLVLPIPGTFVFGDQDSWLAYGGCPGYNTFDVTEVVNGGVRLAEFLNPAGSGGNYPYSAATLNENPEFNAKVISLPYDLSFIWDDPDASKSAASMPARAQLVRDVLSYFGSWYYYPVPVPDAEIFSTKSYPNPFNPQTRIDFNLPKEGKLKLRIFNIRGEIVSTLIDGIRMAGPGSVTWNGTDGEGNSVSAGVYFYEARIDGNVEVGKMALIK